MVTDVQKHRAGFILLIALLSVLFFIGGPDYHSPRSFKHFWNMGHILYFSILPTILIGFPSFRKRGPIGQAGIIFGLTITLGIFVELGQYAFSRTPDMGDLFRNLIGGGISICFLLPVRKTFPARALVIFKSILIILVGFQVYPFLAALMDEHHARNQFPVLSDFQTLRQLYRWEGNAVISIENNISPPGNHSMRAELDTQRYSGVALKYFPRNWNGYRCFEYRMYNPSDETIHITCRIHDKAHTQGPQLYSDRFNRTDSIPSGWHKITVLLDDVRKAPDQREMDLNHIYGVGLFSTSLPHPMTIYIDDVRLY